MPTEMKSGGLSFMIRAAVTLIALGSVLPLVGQAGDAPRGRPVEFSAPRSSEGATNLNQVTDSATRLRQFEQELFKPTVSLSPNGSLGGVPAPVVPPTVRVVPSRQDQEQADRRKNWVFTNPEDLMAVPNVQALSKSPDSDKQQAENLKLSALEQYFLGTLNQQKKPNHKSSKDVFQDSVGEDLEDLNATDKNLPESVRESEAQLRKLLKPANGMAGSAGSPQSAVAANIANEKNSLLYANPADAHKALMEEYRQMLGLPAGNPSVKEMYKQLLAGPESPSKPLPTTLPELTANSSAAKPDNLDVQFGAVPGIPTLPDPNYNKALTVPTAPSTAVKLEKPVPVNLTPPVPTFTAPKRQGI